MCCQYNCHFGTINLTKHLWVEEVLKAVGEDINSMDGSEKTIFDTIDYIVREMIEIEHFLWRINNARMLQKGKGERRVIIHFG